MRSLTEKFRIPARSAPRRSPYSVPPVGRAKGYLSAKAVSSYVPKLTRIAFEKFGFSAATLLTDWAQIAGADLARYTSPERLKWPRAIGQSCGDDSSSTGRPGATLMLRVDPARALDVQYKTAQIVERINAYFGYRAVADLRIVQAAVTAAAPAARRTAPAATPAPALDHVTDPDLRAALERMQQSVMARR